MIPTIRTLITILLLIPFAILPAFFGDKATIAWFTLTVGITLFLAVDYFRLTGFKKATLEIVLPKTLYIGSEDPIVFKITSPLSFEVNSRIRMETVGRVEWKSTQEYYNLKPGENEISFTLRPLRREKIKLYRVVVRISDALKYWELEKAYVCNAESHVIPNIRSVSKEAIKFYGNPEARTGIKIEKHRGQGSEFDALREYIPGFDIRSIDWKVSARKAKMVCREFRAEKNHDVILALDCGHLMAAESNGLTKLDHAINALLVIAYIGVTSGDRIGFLSFAQQVISFFPPRAQINVVEKISLECSELSYQFDPTNFVLAMDYLIHHQKKRSLIIILSDFVDSVSAETMKDYLYILSRRHLVVFVALRDPFLDKYVHKAPDTLMDLHRKVSCYDLRDERFILFQELQRMGIHYLDLYPKEVSLPILNKYIEIRRKELI